MSKFYIFALRKGLSLINFKERERKTMKNRFLAISFALVLLLSTILPITLFVIPVGASTSSGPSLVINDTINRVNATLGIKAGSQITAKGVITNIGTTTLSQLITGVFFAEGTGVAVPSDFSFEFSFDGVTWFPIDPSEVKVAASWTGFQVELVIGQAGGESLNPGSSIQMYLRMTFINDLTPVNGVPTLGLLQSMCVAVFKDANGNRHLDSGEPIYTQPPKYAGVIDWDNPIKIDLKIVHTAELDPVPPMFFYTIQAAIDAASSGDTILVYGGTYLEALYINSKSLTIKAASAPVIKGSQLFATAYGNREAVIFVKDAAQVSLENLDIEGEGLGPARNYGILYQNSGGSIENCIVSPNTIGDMGSTAVAAISRSDLVVENSRIENFGRIGVYATNVENIYVHNNQIVGQVYNRDNLVNYGIEIEDYDGASTAQIIGNRIYNSNNNHPSPLWSSAAIIIDIWRMYYDLTPSNVSMQCNEIYNNYLAIEVVSNPLLWAHYNNIYNNAYGVYVDPDLNNNNETFDARYNWWGTATGPYHPTLNPTGTGSEVGDYVDFIPWMPRLKVLPFVHDVALTKVLPLLVRTTVGTPVPINVTVANEGNTFETVAVTAYYDAIALGPQIITDLAPGASKTITFMWDTTGAVKYHDYTISATVDPVPGETDTADNSKTFDYQVIFGDETLIRVEPPSYRHVLFTGETFKINVTMNGLNVNWRTVGVDLRLGYDPALLELIEVEEGPFMKQAGTTFFVTWNTTIDPVFGPHVGVGILILPQSSSGWTAFPQGSGTLTTFTFRVKTHLKHGSSGSLYCDLKLMDIVIVDDKPVDKMLYSIPNQLQHGFYENLPTNVGDVNYDGVVDIKDLALAAKSFGSSPGDKRWDQELDLNGDDKCDIRDLAIIAKNFGWRRT